MAAGADGVHLPENGLPVAIARWLLGQHTLIGRSVHSKEAAIEAEQAGADYVQLGTIYATESKPDAKPAGLDLVRKVSAAVAIPVLAVGGVRAENAAEVIEAGACGASVISAIQSCRRPRGSGPPARRNHERGLEEARRPAGAGGAQGDQGRLGCEPRSPSP